MLFGVGVTVKRSSSLVIPSHDCLCTKAIVVEYVGFTFLDRLSLALSRHCSDSFLRRRAFYTFTWSYAGGKSATQHILTSIRDSSFGCLFMLCPEKTSSAMRMPVFNAPLPNATAHLLVSGIALRRKPPNRLPSP